jgi:hypothetical protein
MDKVQKYSSFNLHHGVRYPVSNDQINPEYVVLTVDRPYETDTLSSHGTHFKTMPFTFSEATAKLCQCASAVLT